MQLFWLREKHKTLVRFREAREPIALISIIFPKISNKFGKMGEFFLKALVTGGAGFIGSFIADRLIKEGHEVVVLDNLEEQVHPGRSRPSYLNPEAEFMEGDVRSIIDWERALDGIEVVFHDAALVGIGQSMYEVKRYTETNITGTANLFELLVAGKYNVKKVVLASSATIYGEGSYSCKKCGTVYPHIRKEENLKNRRFEQSCPKCSAEVKPIPTPEEKPADSKFFYAITKKMQEDMCLSLGKNYGIPVTALRYFNVFGPRQSLNNPYTGAIAVFSTRLKNNNVPVIIEDGLQMRDFIFVQDIVEANMLAMKSKSSDFEAFNVGTGKGTSIKQLAEILIKLYGKKVKPEINFAYRPGDMRHVFADISKARSKLGFEPKTGLEDGLKKVKEWSDSQQAVDNFDKAFEEYKQKKVIR